MLKRNQVLTVLVATLLTATAHAESWVYNDTIDYGVQVFLDKDSIHPAAYWSNRVATIATMYPKDEAVLLNLEVNCEHKTMRVQGERWYGTNPAKHGGKLVRMICSHKL